MVCIGMARGGMTCVLPAPSPSVANLASATPSAVQAHILDCPTLHAPCPHAPYEARALPVGGVAWRPRTYYPCGVAYPADAGALIGRSCTGSL